MTDTAVLSIALKMLTIVAEVTAPVLAASLLVGLLVSIFQSATQIQEMTLTFVPKLVAVALVLLVGGHWMLNQVVAFSNDLFAMIPQLLNGG